MEEVGTQVAPPLPLFTPHHHHHHPQSIGGGYGGDARLMAKKRNHHHHHQDQHQDDHGWNPNNWAWDTSRFTATPTPHDHPRGLQLQLTTATAAAAAATTTTSSSQSQSQFQNYSSKPPLKKVRSGSPPPSAVPATTTGGGGGTGSGTGTYPKCQVDNCRLDLSNSKDYHRRHKVCEFHSKSTQALVNSLLQRFCQQCSRFHALPEFDEGKRSCRRRLAGHNRRRRKTTTTTQPEDVSSSSSSALPPNPNLDILNLLTALARAKVPADIATATAAATTTPPTSTNTNNMIEQGGVLDINNNNPPSSSSSAAAPTSDFLTLLTTSLAAPDDNRNNMLPLVVCPRSSSPPDTAAVHVHSNKTKSSSPVAGNNKDTGSDIPSLVAGDIISSTPQSPTHNSDTQMEDTNHHHLPLQLFSSPSMDGSPPNMACASRKYFSSDSSNSNPTPIVTRKLFPLETSLQNAKPGGDVNVNVHDVEMEHTHSGTSASRMTLELFSMDKNRGVSNSVHSKPADHAAGYTSSSSDRSPPSFNSSPQRDRTSRISFKLFDKDPSHFPEALRAQIYNWLSNIPSEMESYIRPGCVVLSVYALMPSSAWEQLEGNFLQQVNGLLQGSDSEFWRSGRFSVNIGKQLAVHNDGKILACKSWSTLKSPELFMVSPLAVVSGEDTSLILRGRNLNSPGTRIHCTYMGGYSSSEVIPSAFQGFIYDEIKLSGFKVHTAAPFLGRCFIEVENGARGNSFPLIIADAQVCQELRLLECEFDEDAKTSDVLIDDHAQDIGSPKSHEEVLHFLNELGWLFQNHMSTDIDSNDYILHRYQFLLTFSVERDYCALVKRLLDLFVERNSGMDGLSTEYVESLAKMHLLHRAVKKSSRKMVHLLIHYYVSSSNGSTKKYIFPPNLRGPGAITPLHLAACTSTTYDIVDALTEDPMQVGLNCWNSLLDDNRQSPHSYAAMRNNHSINQMVAQKLTERRNSQVSVSIENCIQESQFATDVKLRESLQLKKRQNSCSKCATTVYSRISRSQSLLHRPFIHSMLAVAAVCVCVSLFFKDFRVHSFAPSMWENMDFGTI